MSDKVTYAVYAESARGITKDGHTMFNQDIVNDLTRKSHLESKVVRLRGAIHNIATDSLSMQERIVELEVALLVIANSNALTIKERLDIGGNGITAYYAQMAANAFNGQWRETK